MTSVSRFWLALAVCMALACASTWQRSASSITPLPYPETRKMELVEEHHGVKVPAPYRWLEDDSSSETRAWNQAQNRVTFDFLHRTGLRELLKKRITELWNFPVYSAPSQKGGRYFFSKNDGLQNQAVVYVQEGLDSEPAVLLDPNTLSDDGTVALSSMFVSNDGKLAAYGLSVHGSDRQEFRVRNIDTGTDLDERIKWCKFTSIAWAPDGSGFYYNRFPEPGAVPKEDENTHNKVYFHRLGTDQSRDALIFEMPDEKELMFSPYVTQDGAYLVLQVFHGTDPRIGIFYARLRDDGQPDGEVVKLLAPGQALYSFIENEGDIFYVHTDRNSPRGWIAAIDTRAPPEKYWRTILPESDTEVVEHALLAGGRLVVAFLKDAHTVVRSYDMGGDDPVELPLPGMGSIRDVAGRKNDSKLFFAFVSFLQPPEIHVYDISTARDRVLQRPKMPFDSASYETNQVFFESKDGTRIPMFLTHIKGLERDGRTPVLLYGYGGFNISLSPYFSNHRLAFLEAGGIFALVNLRGGAEYGEDWHRAGMLENKQNVFDDFCAAAEYLIQQGYTRPGRIATLGGSNGGLLVAVTALQRPELFGAGVAAVPVTDMLRYHRFTVGRYWVPEYGSPENPDHFKFMYAYSPLHNVRTGKDYPPLLVTTADTDDRVVPAHSRKFVATLQADAGRKNPYLIRIETKAGHGRGKPTDKRIQEAADMYAFIFHFLGMKAPGTK